MTCIKIIGSLIYVYEAILLLFKSTKVLECIIICSNEADLIDINNNDTDWAFQAI